MERLFTIFCTACKRETMATKHGRKRVSGIATWEAAKDMIFGVNTCLRCGALYDAPWPGEYGPDREPEPDDDGERGPDLLPLAEDSAL